MFCEKCGKQINDDAEFCPFCGSGVIPVVDSELTIESPDTSITSIKPRKTNSKNKKTGMMIAVISTIIIIVAVLTICIMTSSARTTTKFNEYTISVPSDYSLSAELQKMVIFENKDYSRIEFVFGVNNTGFTKEKIESSPEDFLYSTSLNEEEIGIVDYSDNGAALANGICITGDFTGVVVDYHKASYSNLRKMIVLANDKDICKIKLSGMQDADKVLEQIDITR